MGEAPPSSHLDDDDDKPTVIGDTIAERYRIQAEIGSGGMGVVFRAEHVHMRKIVALKILHRELTYLPEAQELTLLSLSRQTGDCGTWAEYGLAEGNPRLEALYVRMPCPATPGEPANPGPGEPPEGWKRIEVR